MPFWGYSSVGRASALQAECHRFDPGYLHHFRRVAQLGRAPALGAGCRRFESCLSDHFRGMAERSKALLLKSKDVKASGGSNPSPSANFGGVLVSTVLLMNEEARMSWSNGLIQNRLNLNGEDNIAGLLDEAAAIMNNADVVLADFEAEVVA